jgi:DNA-binding transcriptional regulator/RsmH inhibitor MraZ
MRESLRDLRQQSLDRIKKEEEDETTRQFESIVGWLKTDESDQLAIFDTITSEASKYPGTCNWALKQPKIAAWLKGNHDTQFLWLQGNPGTGKSVMASQLSTFLQSDGKALVVRHFCTYAYASSTKFDQILRSLLLQLVRPNADLVAHIYGEHIQNKRAPNTQVLEQLLLTASGPISAIPAKPTFVHVIFDGLDECEPDQQGRIATLLDRLHGVGSPTPTVFKVLLCSRRSPSLDKRFRNRTVVSMTAEKKSIESAIQIYANQRLGSLHDQLSQIGLTQGDIRNIGVNIAKKADGKPTDPDPRWRGTNAVQECFSGLALSWNICLPTSFTIGTRYNSLSIECPASSLNCMDFYTCKS